MTSQNFGELPMANQIFSRTLETTFYVDFFLLVDCVAKFELQFLLIIYLLVILQQPIGVKIGKHIYVKYHFIYTQENFDSPSVLYLRANSLKYERQNTNFPYF